MMTNAVQKSVATSGIEEGADGALAAAQDPEPDSPGADANSVETEIAVILENEAWSALPEAESLCRQAIDQVLARTAVCAIGLTVLLTGDDELQALNKQFRGLDKPTNVLSFEAGDLTGAEAYAGDIAIAAETVWSEASAQGKTVADHLSHMVVHGCLHLFGYDHEVDDEALEMERLEVEILAEIGVEDPYRGTAK